MSKCIFNLNDANLELEDSIQNILEEVYEMNQSEGKAKIVKFLSEIGEGYELASLSNLADFIMDFVEDFAPEMKSYFPSNITTYLAGNFSNKEIITEENVTKLDSLEDPEKFEEDSNQVREFLKSNYGTATEVSDAMEADFMDNIVNCFFVNRNTGTVITTENQINEELRRYQESLLNDIVVYLKDRYSSSITSDNEQVIKTLSELTMYKDGEYTGAVETLNSLGRKYLHHSNYSPDDLSRAFYLKRKDKQQFIKAYNNFVILNHFDSLLQYKLKNVVGINENEQLYSANNRYYIKSAGSHNARNWSDKDKDIDINEQMSDINRLLIETSPLYTWGNSRPIENARLKSDSFNYIISKIKNMANMPESRETVFNTEFFLTYPDLNSIRSYIQGKSMYELLTEVNNSNILNNYHFIFTLLSNDAFFNANQNGLLRNFKNVEKNIIYSMNKSIFGGDNSLYTIFKDTLYTSNYYNYLCQLSATITPLDFIQYRIDDDNNLIRVTLRDNLNSQIRNQIEQRISAALSILSNRNYNNKISKYNPVYKDGIFKFNIPNVNIEVTFNPKEIRSKAFSITRNNNPISFYNGEEDWNNLLPFFKDFLQEDFTMYSALSENYLSLKTINNNIQYDTAISDLLQLTSSVFFNSYFSNNIAEVRDIVAYKEKQLEVFGENNITTIGKDSPEIGLIQRDYIPVLSDIASAYSMTTNSYTSGIQKDGSGNNLSGVSTSMLGATFREQWTSQCSKENSATNHFSLLRNLNLCKGVGVSREYKGRDFVKKHIDFNVSELVYTAFVNNYLCNIVGTNDSAFLPSVISDKSQLFHAVIDLKQLSDTGVAYTDLPKGDIQILIGKEIGKCYEKILNSILEEWNKINEFTKTLSAEMYADYPTLSSASDIPVFNPLTNFAEVNAIYGNNARKALDEILKLYQRITKDESLEIKDELSFIDGKTLSFNRTIISILNRFNPSYFNSKGYNPEDFFGKLTNAVNFWNIKEQELITDLLDNDFLIDTVDENGNKIKTPEIAYLAEKEDWVLPTTKRVVLAKYTNFGKTFNITRWSDLSEIGGYEENGVIYNWNTPGFDLSKFLQLRGGALEVHPDLAKFNLIDYLISQEYVLTTVGTHANHPAKKATESPNDLVEEAARYNAQHKRNVSYTAAKQKMITGTLNGILDTVRVAIIKDAVAPTYNLMGDYDDGGVKYYDGCTFVSPETVYLENYSLGGAEVGTDKKPFTHFYKEDSASGGIVKTAGFALTNFRISNSAFYRNMVRKMWLNPWSFNGAPFVENILVNFQGKDIDYEDIYYKGADNKFYSINDITYNGDGTYTIFKSEVLYDGTIVKELDPEVTPIIQTNYDLYQLFGGWNSYEMSEDGLVPSEASIRNVVKAVNGVGIKVGDKVIQPLKESSINYVITGGAIKQGAANVNLVSAYTDNSPYLTMTYKTSDMGVQLDAEHSADEATISIMTQVLNALPSRGYTIEEAREVYEAMLSLAETNTSEYLEGLKELSEEGNPNKFKDAIISTLAKAILSSSSKDGNLMQAVLDNVISRVNSGKSVSYKNLEGVIPFSDPGIFNQMCSTLSATLTKLAVKLKFNGNLAVLNPSHRIWKLFGDRLLNSFNRIQEIENLQRLLNTKPINISDVRLGRVYEISINGEAPIREFIETPQQYWNLKSRLTGNNYNIVEYILGGDVSVYSPKTKEYVITSIEGGRDLATYNFTFKTLDGESYNMWDLAVVKELYEFEGNKTLLRRELQSALAAVSTGKLNQVRVIDKDGNIKTVEVDKSTLQVSPYELIMPKIYSSKFGLRTNDDLFTIKNDDLFFFKRMLNNWEDKVDDKNFDIELKRLDGKHTYLIDSRFYKETDLTPIEIETRWDGNKLFRVNSRGEKLHRLGSETDQIYVDSVGNEVIVTKNTQFYIDSFDYHTLKVSDSAALGDNIDGILQPIKSSDSKGAQRLIKYIGKSVPSDIITYTNQLYKTSIQKLKENPRAKISDPVIQDLKDSALEVHTSFIKSLDVLAARIPAQSMQSFMPMRVVGFDNTDKNSAYVNYFQFWLQGSDLDIDKVSLLGYSFNKTGKFIGWSPYFNLYNSKGLKDSEALPFPTGKELELEETSDSSLTNWGSNFVGSGKLFNFNGQEVIFLPDYDLDNSLNSIKMLGEFLRMIKKNGNKLYIPKGSSLPFNKIKDLVDKHNLYTTTSPHSEEMIKNFVSSYMFKISSNPINLMQSQSSIDDSMKELDTIANNSSSGQKSQKFTPGNVVNKYESMNDCQVGKKDVGIVASAIKVFDGLTFYYNSILRSADRNKQVGLLFYKNVCGGEYRLLANSYTDSPELVMDSSVLQALYEIDNDIDAKLTFSALMTAATDNAKDPKLAKINAGIETMGLYTYGTAIGIPLSDLAGVMMSRTARILSKIMKSNVFSNKSGMSITSALRYLEEGPSIENLDPEFIQILKTELGISSDVSEFVIGKILTNVAADYNKGHSFITNLKSKLRQLPYEVNKVPLYKFLEELTDYMGFLQVIQSDYITNKNGNTYLAISSIKELSKGASEMGRLRTIYGLNTGLPNKIEDKFKFIDKFENIFTERIGELTEEDRNSLVSVNGMIMKVSEVIEKLRNTVNNPKDSYRISLEKFIENSEYRDTLIALYGGLKHSFNVLDAVWSVPHYRGNLQSFYLDIKSNYMMMSKYRMLKDLGPKVIKQGNYNSVREKLMVYKRLQSFCDMTLRNTWMKASNRYIMIPEGVTIINSIGNEVTTKVPTPIMLGTKWGNASFKMWMESVVIPELKETNPNKFIQDISPVKLKRTLSGNAALVYSLPINVLSKVSSEIAKLKEYKRAFNQLQSDTPYNGYSLVDLFYYYNLITFNGAVSQMSLSVLFEDIYKTHTSPLIEDFQRFTSLLDSTSELMENVDYTLDSALQWCASIGSTRNSSNYYIREYVGSEMRYNLYRKRETQSDDILYEDTIEDYPDFIDEDSNEGFSGYNSVGPDLQKYELVYSDTPLWDIADIASSELRLNPNILMTIGSDKEISTLKYKDKIISKEELLKLVEQAGGTSEDIKIPFMTFVVDGISKEVVDTSLLSDILTSILDNPC